MIITRPALSGSINPSFGIAPINPSDLTDIWEWWEPSRESYTNGQEIATLVGQKNARNMTGFFAGFTPLMSTNVLNGLAVASCPTGFKSWTGPNMTALTAADILALVKFDADPAANNAHNALWEMGNAAGGEASTRIGKDSTGHVHDAAFTNSLVDFGDPSPSLASWCMYEVISVTNNLQAWVNDSQIGSTITTNTVSPLSNPRIGCTGNGSMVGLIAGIYLCSASISTAQRQGLVAYINNRFALSLTTH